MTNEQAEAVVLRLAREAAAQTVVGWPDNRISADFLSGRHDNYHGVQASIVAIRLAFEEAAKIAEGTIYYRPWSAVNARSRYIAHAIRTLGANNAN